LLQESQTQAMIARTLKRSRTEIHREIQQLQTLGIIRPKHTARYNIIYDVAPEFAKTGEMPKVTPFRVHNIAMKFRVIERRNPFSTDKRITRDQKEWNMRNGIWRSYTFLGGAGEPSFTVTAYPRNSLVCRMDKRQRVLAPTDKEAEDKAYQYCVRTVTTFVELQNRHGAGIRIEPTGTKITKPHHGTALPEQHPVAKAIVAGNVPKWFGDGSLQEMGVAGITEGETLYHEEARKFERAMELPDRLPEMLKGIVDPLNRNVERVMAQMQGGRPIEVMFQNALDMMLRMMERIDKQEQRIKELEKR